MRLRKITLYVFIFLILWLSLAYSQTQNFSRDMDEQDDIQLVLASPNCSGILDVFNLENFIEVAQQEFDHTTQQVVAISNLPEGSYIIGVENLQCDDFPQYLEFTEVLTTGWLLEDGNLISKKCPYPLPLKTVTITSEHSTVDLGEIEVSSSILGCTPNADQSISDGGIISLVGEREEIVSGVIYYLPAGEADGIPKHAKYSKNKEFKLPPGGYYIWAYGQDPIDFFANTYEVSRGWSYVSIESNQVFELQLYQSPATVTINLSNGPNSFLGADLCVYKKDPDTGTWKILLNIDDLSPYVVSEDSIKLSFLPEGTYKFGFKQMMHQLNDTGPFIMFYYGPEGRSVKDFAQAQEVILNGGENTSITWSLPPTYTIKGHVVNNDGTNATYVEVRLSCKDISGIGDSEVYLLTDKNGFFSYSGIPQGVRCSIIAIDRVNLHAGYIDVSDNSSVTITLEKPLMYFASGQVVDEDNTPLIGALIKFYQGHEEEEQYPDKICSWAVSRGDGRFDIYVPNDVSEIRMGTFYNGRTYYYSSNNHATENIENSALVSSTQNELKFLIPAPYHWKGNCEGPHLRPPVLYTPSQSYDFGGTGVNNATEGLIEVFNIGSGFFKITDLSIQGSSDFTIITNNCLNNVITQMEKCRVKIGFTPSGSGEKRATLTIITDSNQSIVITLKGNGIGEGNEEGNETGEQPLSELEEIVEESEETGEIPSPQDIISGIQQGREILDSTVEAINQGQSVSIDRAVSPLKVLHRAAELAIEGGANADQLNQIKEFAVHSMHNLPVIVQGTSSVEDVKKTTGVISEVIKGGILAQKARESEITEVGSQLISKIDEIGNRAVDKTVSLAPEPQKAGAMGKVLESVGNELKDTGHFFNSLKQEGLDQQVSSIVDNMQEEVKSVVGHTNEKISVLGSQNVSSEDGKVLANGIGKIAQSVLEPSDTGLKEDVFTTIRNSADTIFNMVQDDILTQTRRGPLSLYRSENGTDLISDPIIRDKIIKIASIDVTNATKISREEFSQIVSQIADQLDLDENQVASVVSSLAQLSKPEKALLSQGNNSTIKALDIITSLLNSGGTQGNVLFISEGQTMMLKVLKNNQEEYKSIGVSGIKVVPSVLSDGYYTTPTGESQFIQNGIGIVSSPAPLDPVGFVATLTKIFSPSRNRSSFVRNDNGTQDHQNIIQLTPDGYGRLYLQNGIIVSFGFSYLLDILENRFGAGAVSFEVQGEDPASSTYSILVRYEDGSTQSVPPATLGISEIIQMLNTYFPGNYSIDRNTGVIEVLGLRFKSDYYVFPMNESERSWYEANKDAFGIAWQSGDYNSDGLIDLKMFIEDGYQIIYSLP